MGKKGDRVGDSGEERGESGGEWGRKGESESGGEIGIEERKGKKWGGKYVQQLYIYVYKLPYRHTHTHTHTDISLGTFSLNSLSSCSVVS